MTKLISEESKGVFVIMATPFTEDGALDLRSADRLVEFYLEEGVHGLTVLGVMGEAPKLSLEEQDEFTRHVLKRVDGRVPVIVGVSNPGMDNLVTLSRTTMDQGAGGVMIAGIPGLKTDEQVESYFKAVADRLGEEVPICLQDYPPTTTVFISVGVVNRLIADIPHLKMFKHEDCPGHRKLTRLRQAPETDGYATGEHPYRQQRALRAAGARAGRRRHHDRDSHFPGCWSTSTTCSESGKAEEAEDLFDLYLPVLRHEQQFGFGLALRKETLRRRGAIASAKARDPGPRMDARDHAEMDGLLERLKQEADLPPGTRFPPVSSPLDAQCRRTAGMAHRGYTRQSPQQLMSFY